MSTAHTATPRVVALAIPLMVSSLASAGLGFFAAIQVAPRGADALAAVSFGAMLTSLVQALGLGFFAGGRIAIAQALGAGDARRAAALSRRMLQIAGALSLAALALVPLSAALVRWVGVPLAAAPEAADYLAVRLLGAPAMFFLDAAVHIVQGRGDAKDTRLTMLAIIVLCGVAIAAATALVAASGTAGAAWSANIGIAAGLALLVPRVMRATRGSRPPRKAPPDIARSKQGAFPILALGWPLAALNLADVASGLALQALLAHLGDAELAAHVLVVRLTGVTSLPAYAIGDALAVMIGRAAGAARPDLVRPVARVALQLATAFVAMVMTTFMVGSEALASAIGATPEVAVVAGRLLVVAALCQLVEGVVAVGLGALAGLGQTRFLLFATLVTAWLVKLPTTALLVARFGIEAAWWATGLELAILAVLVTRRLRPTLSRCETPHCTSQVVRQTTVSIAHLAAQGGARAPLSDVAEHALRPRQAPRREQHGAQAFVVGGVVRLHPRAPDRDTFHHSRALPPRPRPRRCGVCARPAPRRGLGQAWRRRLLVSERLTPITPPASVVEEGCPADLPPFVDSDQRTATRPVACSARPTLMLCGIGANATVQFANVATKIAANAKRICMPRAALDGLAMSVDRTGETIVLNEDDDTVIADAPECTMVLALVPRVRLEPGDRVRFELRA